MSDGRILSQEALLHELGHVRHGLLAGPAIADRLARHIAALQADRDALKDELTDVQREFRNAGKAYMRDVLANQRDRSEAITRAQRAEADRDALADLLRAIISEAEHESNYRDGRDIPPAVTTARAALARLGEG